MYCQGSQRPEAGTRKRIVRSLESKKMALCSSWGITLLELMVALVLIAIMSALVYPSFGNAMANLRLNGLGRQVTSACRLAKSEAVTRREPYRLLTNIEKNQMWVTNASSEVQKELEFPPGIKMIQVQKISTMGTGDVGDFYFFPNGTAEAGSITFRDERGKELKVQIDFLTGEAKVVQSDEKPLS